MKQVEILIVKASNWYYNKVDFIWKILSCYGREELLI